MKSTLVSSIIISLVSFSALAGPAVTVTFKNQGTQEAVMIVEDKNELLSFADSMPKPKSKVVDGDTDKYIVQNTMVQSMNMAHVHYRIGTKHCVFRTVYMKNTSGIPQWTKSDKPSGGAFCNSVITSANPVSHEWSIELIMK